MKIELVVTFTFGEDDPLVARYGAVTDVVRMLDSPDLEAGEEANLVVVSVSYEDVEDLLDALGGTPGWKDSEPPSEPPFPSALPTGLE